MLTKAFISLMLAYFGMADDDGYTCPIQAIVIDPPTDISQPVYFPTDWTEAQPPATFKPNQKCQWKVTVPQGLYAQVVFYKKTDAGKDIFVQYPNMQIENIATDDHNPYIFASPYVYFLMYQSNLSGAFSFKVQWKTYPDVPRNTVRVSPGNAPIAMKPNSNFTTFQADTQVSLTGFSVKTSDQQYLLRRTAVFAGGSTDGEFIGTLSHVFRSSDQIVTVNDKLTVYTFDLESFIDYPLFMAQDYSDYKHFRTIRGWNCPDTGECSIEINSVSGPSVMVTVGDTPDFIKGFSYINENSTLKVYEGMISEKHLISTITKGSYPSQLPMKINNNMKFYVVDQVRLVMTQTKQIDNAKWNRVTDGRSSFMHSYNYGFDSNQQDTTETLTTYDNEQLYFNLAMTNVDLTHFSTTLSVRVLSNGNEVFSELYGQNQKQLPRTVSACGDTLKVVYSTIRDYTDGFLIDFSVSKEQTGTSKNAPTTLPVVPVTTTTARTEQVTTKPTIARDSTTRATIQTTTSGTSSLFSLLFIVCVIFNL